MQWPVIFKIPYTMTDFKSVIEEMRLHGMPAPQVKKDVILSIPGAHELLKKSFDYILSLQNIKAIWRKEYDQVGEWLSNNDGRGLLLWGNCGLGKSLLGRYIIPAILLKFCRKIVNVYNVDEMNQKIDEILRRQFISLDDIGTEELVNVYGNKRLAFAEIMDAVEKQSKLVIISTNLNNETLIEKYGYRVYDRIIATTRRVRFEGDSLRR